MSVEQMELLTEIKQEPEHSLEFYVSDVKVEPDFEICESTDNNTAVHMTRSKTKSTRTVNRATESEVTDGKVIDPTTSSQHDSSASVPVSKPWTGLASTINKRSASTKNSQCTSTIKQLLESKILNNMSNGGPFSTAGNEPTGTPCNGHVNIRSIQPVQITSIEPLRSNSNQPVSIASIETNSSTSNNTTGYTVLKNMLSNGPVVINNGPVVINTGLFQQQLSNMKLPIPRLNPPPSNLPTKEKKSQDNSDLSKDFSCGVCGKLFRHASNVRTHMLIHTGQKPHACSTCGKKFSDESNRRRHELTHQEQDRPFKCEICDKSYSRSHHLDRHLQTHNNDRPFACEVCDKTFKFKSHLFEHNKIHTGERTLSCDFCSLSFPRKYQLQVHRRTHTGEKPHMCIICGRSFSIGSALKSHMCLHTGEKFYKCVCGKAYSRKGHLQKHVRAAHTNNETDQLDCAVCSESFDNTLSLIKHMEETHKDIVNSENKTSDDLIAANIFKILKSNSTSLKNEKNYENVTKIITEKLGLTPDQFDFSKIRQAVESKMDAEVSQQQQNDVTSTENDNLNTIDNTGTPDDDYETLDESMTDSNMSSDNIEDQNYNIQECTNSDTINPSIEIKTEHTNSTVLYVNDSENCQIDEESNMDQEPTASEKSCAEYLDQDNDNMKSTSQLSVKDSRDVDLKDVLNQMEKKWEFINYTEQDMEDGNFFEFDREEEYEDLASMGPHVCRLCGMRFTNWEFMQEHLYAHIDKLERFISRAKSKHRDINDMKNDADEEEKRFICGICGMGFLTQARLNKHLRKHTGEKTVKCDICDKRLVDSHALRKHQRVHTGEKPYTCDICGKKFAQSSNLHTHIRVHHSGSVK